MGLQGWSRGGRTAQPECARINAAPSARPTFPLRVLALTCTSGAMAGEEDGAAAATLQAALQGVRECAYVPPQLLLFSSKHTADWGAHFSPRLKADGEAWLHMEHCGKAFTQFLVRQVQPVNERALRLGLAALPSMEGVELRHELSNLAAGGAPAAKPRPPSRLLREVVAIELWPRFKALVEAAGEARAWLEWHW